MIGTGWPGLASSGAPVPAVSCTKVMPVIPASWIDAVESTRIGVSRETRICARTFEGSALSIRTLATSPTFTPIYRTAAPSSSETGPSKTMSYAL